MKLSMDMRDRIANKVLDLTLKEREQALAAEEDALAVEVYSRIYPAEIQEKMDALPDEFFAQQSEVYVEDALNPSLNPIILKMSSSRKVSAHDSITWRSPRLAMSSRAKKDRVVTDRIQNLISGRQRLNKDRLRLRETVRSFLEGFNTTAQLEKEWPDWTLYYDIVPAPAAKPPAIRGAEIQHLIKTMLGQAVQP